MMSLLHIGDIISLYSNGFLSTLGLVDDRCVVQPDKNHEENKLKDPPKKFRDCLFKVCIQHKYDVQNELWKSSRDCGELYKKLNAASKLEQDSNYEKNQEKRGTVVKYEDTIQLLHLKSNKYITINTKQAPNENDAFKVYLDSNGNEGSWLVVRSPYKYRSNGEDVVCESIALVSHINGYLSQDDALYLHTSSKTLKDHPDCLEINASKSSTSWDIKPFLDYSEDSDDFLKGGDVVRLFHTDQEKFLTMDTYKDQTQYVFLRSTDRAKATSATSSKALWEVEVVQKDDPCKAAIARWSSVLRLKHLATERFLAAEMDIDKTPDPMRDKLRQKGSSVYKLVSVEFSYDLSEIFEFDPTTMNVNVDDYIPIQSNITLKHFATSTYVHSTSIFIDKDNEKSCMSKVGCAQNKGLDEVFAVIPVAATEIRDLDFVYDACTFLTDAYDLINENSPDSRLEAHKKLSELLPEVIHFIANKENEPKKVENAFSMVADDPNRERQKLLREQNVLQLLFDILKLEDEQKEDMNKNICRLCYRVLMLSFQDYRKNQEYIVKWVKSMQCQFGKDIEAEQTYSALFNSNKNILNKFVKLDDINKFVELIRKKRQSSFLDCLSKLCITTQIQILICDSILSESNNDILIETIFEQQPSNNEIIQIQLSTKHWSPFESNLQSRIGESCNIEKSLNAIVFGSNNDYDEDRFILDYYKHQLDLFSSMCSSNQTKAINLLKDRLPLRLIQTCISDSKLPFELRASFCRLLLNLHLICDPQKTIPPINLKRYWKNIPKRINIDDYDDIIDNNRQKINFELFRPTMDFVEQYLSYLTSISKSTSIFLDSDKNKLTYEVVNLIREFTYFGFYSLRDILSLTEILLIVLEDNRNEHKLVMKTKTKIIETLQYMSQVRIDYMLTSLLTIFKSEQESNLDSSGQIAMKINQALEEHLNGNVDINHGRKFVDVLLHLVGHDCQELVSASLKLLLNYRSQRSIILETFKKIELLGIDDNDKIREKKIYDNFLKLHTLNGRFDKYVRKGRDENHIAINEILIQDSKLITNIVSHIQYLLRCKDEENLTMNLLRLLKDLIPINNDHNNISNNNNTSNSINNSNINNNSDSHQHHNHNYHHHSSSNQNQIKNKTKKINQNHQHISHHNSKKESNTKKDQKEKSEEDSYYVQNKLDTHGTSNLVVELISMGSTSCEEKMRERSCLIFEDTIALGIALLEGGNLTIQGSIYNKLSKKSEQEKSERFFEVLSNRINLAQQSLNLNTGSQLPKAIQIMKPILRFLQLLCEDHNLAIQNYIRSQQNKTNYNLVAKTLVFLNCICGSKEGSLGHKLGEYIRENNIDLINQTLRTLTEYCQGPCIENQQCILMHESNGIDMIRSIILDNIEPLIINRMDSVLELKDNAAKLLLALMESCSDPHHAERILGEPSLIKKLTNISINYYHEQSNFDNIFAELCSEEVLTSSDGLMRPRDVGHKVFILCHQLVQQYNTLPYNLSNNQSMAKIQTSNEAAIAAEKCENSLKEKERYLNEETALRYYECHTAQIEIVRGNREMERVVFPVPQICEYLTDETKSNVYNNTEQDERGSKIPNFFQTIEDLYGEMKWQRELQNNPILHSIARYMSLWSSVEFKLSCFVTVLVLFCVSKPIIVSDSTSSSLDGGEVGQFFGTNNTTTSAAKEVVTKRITSSFMTSLLSTILAIACSTFFVLRPRIPHSWTLFLICTTFYLAQAVGECITLKILGLFLESVTMMHLFSVLINKGIINKALKETILESDVLYHGGYLSVCTLGFLFNPLFYPFLLPPSLIRREETLRNVIKSVTKNAYSILMTGFLGLIIILLYTIIDYLFFANDFVIELEDGVTYQPCLGTLWECYIAHVNYGLRDGGGIGERFKDERFDLSVLHILRIVCIMSFFLVVNLMILQLVYCIIVDTFATLRGEKQQKEEVLKNTCFVCGLDRSMFENRTVTFEDHIRTEHNLWHYLYFIVLIKTKSRTELSGPESYVYDMLKNKDYSWFPRMRAMSLSADT